MDQELGNGRLCLKLKIPKPEPPQNYKEEEEEEDEVMEEEEEEEEDDEVMEEEEEDDDDDEDEDEDEDDDDDNDEEVVKEDKDEEKEVVLLPYKCQVCGKRFKSGKALGGHKRIHNQQAATATNTMKIMTNNYKFKMKKKDEAAVDSGTPITTKTNINTVCPSCFKIFHSSKSLYGHMRSHPERNWRGIKPPTSPKSSSSTAPLSLPLTWAVTAKRGRKANITSNNTSPAPASALTHATTDHDDHDSVEDRRNYEAVQELMMLSLGTTTNRPPPPPPLPSQDHHHQYKNFMMMIKKRKLPHDYDDEDSDSSSDSNLMLKKSSISRRKIKLVDDLDLGLHSEKPKLKLKLKPKPKPKPVAALAKGSSNKYECLVCQRQFPCHQALGGHMSIHNNKTNTAPAPPAPAPAPRRLLNIDLNKPPPDEDDQ